jgi:uncharacterized membrane protein YfcA
MSRPLRPRSDALTWALPLLATLAWVLAIQAIDGWQRVSGNWPAAATMFFGSLLAGSSPEGGGAVAFPVFTKLLHIPSSVARSFGLSIQAVGMTMAVATIVIAGRKFHRRAALVGSIAGAAGFLVSAFAFGRPDELFWPSSIGAPWVKATFSIVLATTSILMLRHLRHGEHNNPRPEWNGRYDTALAIIAFGGGFLSSLTGTGANIVVFLFLVVVADVTPRVALPTALVVMSAVSIIGLVLFGLVDGQLDVSVIGERVVSVGDQLTDLPSREWDLLGLWLAAIPVVVWGAPIGSYIASRVNDSHLVRFVAALAAFEVATTFILVPQLRTSPALIAYLLVGLVLLPTILITLARRRDVVFSSTRS